MSKTKASKPRAYTAYLVITLVTSSVHLSKARSSLLPRSGGWPQCGQFIDINYNGPPGTMLCGTSDRENYQCDKDKCNSGEGPSSDPKQHPFSQMTWHNCQRDAQHGEPAAEGRTVTRTVSMHADYQKQTVAVWGGEAGLTSNFDFFYTCAFSAENDRRSYCRDCTLVWKERKSEDGLDV
ncbi:hypothetical protein PGT21_004820 [Puccinia graminis f. sp. tritici]|uniref:Uncharacterized protein n=1 Tax=Puccinia graminis f. sp. tritici TaxID=56615 RepID=A0A5B0NMQ5_PUCGR|nr:hypothetical protein PGT21_004820 [Puccinia graminis f. sp. tritici]